MHKWQALQRGGRVSEETCQIRTSRELSEENSLGVVRKTFCRRFICGFIAGFQITSLVVLLSTSQNQLELTEYTHLTHKNLVEVESMRRTLEGEQMNK